jgi:hypothetical protein
VARWCSSHELPSSKIERHVISNLLAQVLHAHGGLENWRKVVSVEARLTLSGSLFEIKGHPNGLRTVLMRVDVRRPKTTIVPFPVRGKRGVFESGRVYLQADNGDPVSELKDPRSAYEGHVLSTPWNDLQYLYFVGYAFWNYLTTPFLLAADGVAVEEIEPWREHNQTWRVLEATFDESIDTHCAQQRFYFDDNGMLARLDYFADVAKGTAAHYCYDSRPFDGFVFPTHRRVVRREADGQSVLTGRSGVWIELESVVVNRE